MTTYAGACHCGTVRFEIEAEIDHVRSCDRSVCSMRGALIFRVGPDSFRLLSSPESLSCYRWGSLTAADYFCSTCGMLPFRKPGSPTADERRNGAVPFDGWSINTRCLSGFDPSSVPTIQIAGSRLTIDPPARDS